MTSGRCVSRFSLPFLLLVAPAAFAEEYRFPLRGDDLNPGERVFTGNHARGIQGEGEDLVGRRYVGDGKWSRLKDGGSETVNKDYVLYDKGVFAMADGKVVGCWRNAPQNPPGGLHKDFVTGYRLVDGTRIAVGRIPGGGNMLFVDNTDGKRVLYAHMQPDTVPAELCPNNAALFPRDMTIPEGDDYLMLPSSAQVAIRKGRFLGKVGNSGSSSEPHLHIHAERAGEPAIMRFERGLSKPFVEGNTDIKGGWTSFAGKEVPDGEVLIRPPRAAPYRMADFEAFETNGSVTYVGIFRPGSYGPMALFENDWDTFLARWKAIEAQGYRMKDFEFYQRGSKQVYAGIFAPGSYAPMALFKDSWEGFLDGWKAIEAKGYRMKDLEVFRRGGKTIYAGIFAPGSHAPMALFKSSWQEFLDGWKAIEGKGYRMKDLEIYQSGSKKVYAGIFEPGTHAPMALFKSSWQDFLHGWRAIEAKGYRIIDIEVAPSGSGFVYAGIFEPGSYNPAAWVIPGDWDAFTEAWQQME
jgi:Bacterial tandem repeat domain 1